MPGEAQASLELQHSEAIVVHTASRIFAAYIGAGQVNAKNEEELIEYSVRTAAKITAAVGRFIQSDR